MKFAYKFSNLLGTVYCRGNLNFTPDGNSVISPVGNRITLFDLKNNKSETLPFATCHNIVCVGLSPDGNLAVLVDEEGAALLISLLTKSVLHQFHFHKPVHSVAFSPDGRKFVITKDNVALMYHAPGRRREFNTFVLDKSYYGPYDETTCIDWTDDSKCFVIGSKDMSTWVFGAKRWANLVYYSLGGHKNSIMGCYFEANSLNLYTVSRDGVLCVWECDTELAGLKSRLPKDEVAIQKPISGGEKDEEEGPEVEEIHGKANPNQQEHSGKVKYSRTAKYFFNKEGDFNNVTAVAYHKKIHLLVTGFASGIFHLHELPDFNLIHSLSISDQSIASIAINGTGDWIAFGCSGPGLLLVWEWQSESYVLKQQGHFNNMASLAYSPDGQHLVTGGDDGKVKVWNASSGFCFVTFTEHTSSVTAVTFTSSGFVVVSASLDGTVRAFDLHRYRNFRTFTAQRLVQFSCLAVDFSGEIVCAGSQDAFDVYVWSMQTGRLLDVLAGHEGPVSSISFSPSKAMLATASWDKNVRLWNMSDSWRTRETLSLTSDVLAVTFRPDGRELAVCTLDGQITFWDPEIASQTGSIEGRHDIQMGRRELDKITAKQAAKGRSFTSLCYSADGQSILVGGSSKFVCIYSVEEQILMKKFEISCNLSLDAMEEYLDRRKMTEFGSLALLDEGAGDGNTVDLALPGVKRGDMSSRSFKPEIRVTCLRFSPTGRSWAATTTEGLLIYSLDSTVIFDPFELDLDITPSSVRKVLWQKKFTAAIVMAFRLNEKNLIKEVLEHVPYNEIDVVCSSLPELYVEKVLQFLASALETSRHLEFYLTWTQQLLVLHGQKLKTRSETLLPMILSLQKSIQSNFEDVSKLCDWNRYNLKYALAISQQRGLKRSVESSMSDEDSDTMEACNMQPMEDGTMQI
ncbi:periodic tryptophan protein 2 homolog [Microcaecilia unicolor]|uniref:Periodic tryptophan protein 2 homolog n=1 Tax=Microcaecilia unicolor TaxID=1415580 RepID=A0A6P7XW11_9AMPH|nr:periodic tryptophan protein 2 homolog [Microcaecilia unicolor]